MNTTIINKDMEQQWEDFVLAHPDTVAWQSYRWNDVLQKHYAVTFYPIAAYDHGRICGILPLYHMHTGMRKNRLISVPYAVAGGIAAQDAEAASVLLNEANRLRKIHGDCCVTLKQYKVRIDGDLVADSNYYNRELRLQVDMGAIFDSFAPENRTAIEQAEKLDLRIAYPSADIDGFYEVLLNHHLRRGLPCVAKRWIADLVSCGMYSLALALHEESVVAGTMVKQFKATVSFPFTCAASEADEAAAPYWLYWQLIRHYAREGTEIFHSGRIPNNNDTDPYRLGWGGQRYSYYYQYLTNASVKTEYATNRGAKRNMGQTVWKHLPRPVAKALGPRVVRQYP